MPEEQDIGKENLTSPQRRELLSDYQARKALDKLKTKIGEKTGVYVPDEATWTTPDVSVSDNRKVHAVITFTIDTPQTKMKMATHEGSAFFEKTLSGYNVESAAIFAKNAMRIIESINAMY